MNINELTIGQLKDLQQLLGQNGSCFKPEFLAKKYIGKYVICRTRNEGVNAGKVVDLDETGIILEDARRLYYHEPKDEGLSWYEGVASSGLSDNSKISNPTQKVIIENYSLTICTKEAEKNIRNFKTNEQ